MLQSSRLRVRGGCGVKLSYNCESDLRQLAEMRWRMSKLFREDTVVPERVVGVYLFIQLAGVAMAGEDGGGDDGRGVAIADAFD